MKKILWSIVAATLIILTGCANTAATTQPEDPPPTVEVESVLESAGPVENETIVLSAGNDQLVDNTTVEEDTTTEDTVEPAPQAEPPAAPQPQEPQSSVRASVTFVPDSKEKAVENSTPAPSDPPQETPQAPEAEPEPTPTPAPPTESEQPAEPVPPAASEPAEPTEPTFSIDYWIGYAQEYARSVGLNLDSTAVDCWDNPITAGAHCTCLERDIQSRLNRYAGDETILDVWIWAESRSDGNYNLYIGYA